MGVLLKCWGLVRKFFHLLPITGYLSAMLLTKLLSDGSWISRNVPTT